MQSINQGDSAVNPLHPSVLERLDPAFVKLYNAYIAHVPPHLDLGEARREHNTLYSYARTPASGVGGIGETTVPGWNKYPKEIDVRVYVPTGEDHGERKVWPVHFNFHGGGWAVGDLETDAHLCHHICALVPCCVIDINYRLVPEWPFPVGILDAVAAIKFIVANAKIFSIDTTKMTLGGQSTGGTIALISNHLLRDIGMGDAIKGVVVGTPSITGINKIATAQQSPYPSMQEAEHAPLLNWTKLKWLETLKLMSLTAPCTGPSTNKKDVHKDVSWFADALSAPNFKDLAPLTWIGTAEVDPLRDEGEAYAEKLKENGNKVIVQRYTGMPHPFMHMDKALVQAREYIHDVSVQIRQCLYS